jgi:hypothetical protein
MIGLPSVPTDSLYEFIAVSGFVLAIFATGLLYLSTERASDAAAAFEVNKAKGLTALTYFEADTLRVPAAVRETSAVWRDRLTALATLTAEGKGLRVRVERERPLQSLLNVSIGLGSALASFGFVLWYRRIQRFQDELLMIEVTERARRLPKSRSSKRRTVTKRRARMFPRRRSLRPKDSGGAPPNESLQLTEPRSSPQAP